MDKLPQKKPGFKFSQKKSSKGFTLIELLVVIALIAVLTALGAFSYTESQKRARDAQRESDLQKIALALEEYFNDHRQYPEEVVCLIGDASCQIPSTQVYLSKVPQDPKDDSNYLYEPGTNVGTSQDNFQSYTISAPAKEKPSCTCSISKPD